MHWGILKTLIAALREAAAAAAADEDYDDAGGGGGAQCAGAPRVQRARQR